MSFVTGRHYIKLGVTDKKRGHLETRSEVKQWFDKGNTAFQESTAKFIKKIFNGNLLQYISPEITLCLKKPISPCLMYYVQSKCYSNLTQKLCL